MEKAESMETQNSMARSKKKVFSVTANSVGIYSPEPQNISEEKGKTVSKLQGEHCGFLDNSCTAQNARNKCTLGWQEFCGRRGMNICNLLKNS